MKTLHVFGPSNWHDQAVLVGNRQALLSVRRAINRALADGKGRLENIYTNDGEGFSFGVFCTEKMEHVALPYYLDFARENDEDAAYPVMRENDMVFAQFRPVEAASTTTTALKQSSPDPDSSGGSLSGGTE